MAKVKVWNDNVHAHVEDFKGSKIAIPAKSFIEMDWEEAVEFKGQFTPMAPADCPTSEREKFFKKIRIEGGCVVQANPLVCHADGTRAETPEELKAKLLQFADRMVKDDELDKTTKVQGSEIDDLKRQVAELRDMLAGQVAEKRGVGRPKKVATA